MFDGGNMLRLRTHGQWTKPLKYTQVCNGMQSEPAGAWAEYNTCKLPGPTPLFAGVFFSPTAAIDGIRVDGNTGADGSGSVFANPGSMPLHSANTSNGQVYGYYKQSYGEQATTGGTEARTPDPSINHLIVVRAASGTTQVGTTTDSDLFEVAFSHGVYEVYYFLFAGKLGVQFSEAAFQAVLERMTSCLPAVMTLPNSPPPPARASTACARSCGDGTCQRFEHTSCAAVTAVMPGCDCSGCCSASPFNPVKVSPPPPAPSSPPPPAAACSAPCAGTTCAAFAGTSCADFDSKLGCDCSGCCAGSPGNLQCVLDKWPGLVPNLYPFTDGESGRTIHDGGSDMYDDGNYLNLKVGGEWLQDLQYNQDCYGRFSTTLFGGKAEYSTCKLTDGSQVRDGIGDVTAGTLFAAAFTSKTNDITGLAITGNLGADGEGHQVYLNITGPRGVTGYFKQVYGAQDDPSINHLILARSDLKEHYPTVTTNSDWQETMFTHGQPAIYYLLWAGKEPTYIPGLDYSNGYKYSRDQVAKVVEAMAHSCFPPAVSVPPSPPPTNLGPAPESCSRTCGQTTCLAFRTTPCATIQQPPWSCDCGDCCASNELTPPPSPPPSPPHAPPPAMPEQCGKSCKGSTCGAFYPYSCSAFESVLGCDCTGCCDTVLDAQCVDRAWPANLPSLYSFSGGYIGDSILDGGSDMYDTGNQIRIRVAGMWSSPLYYSQVCDGSAKASVYIGDASYVTCKIVKDYYPGYGAVFVAVIESPRGLIDGIMTTGNLGADGGGSVRANNGTDNTYLRGKMGTSGYYKQVYHAQNDPSVNHLIFAQGPNAPGATTHIGPNSNDDLHEVRFTGGVNTLFYVLWAGKQGHRYDEEAFQGVLDAVASSCLTNPSGYVPPGGRSSSGDGGGGGGGGAGVFFTVIVVLFLIGLVGVLGYGFYKGWRYPKTSAAISSLSSKLKFKGSGRSQTTPTPAFDSVGPLSSANNISCSRNPLAMSDSATPYVQSPVGATPYTPPPSGSC